MKNKAQKIIFMVFIYALIIWNFIYLFGAITFNIYKIQSGLLIMCIPLSTFLVNKTNKKNRHFKDLPAEEKKEALIMLVYTSILFVTTIISYLKHYNFISVI